MFDPVSLGASAGLGILGLFQGSQQKAAAQAQNKYNAQQAALQSLYAPLVQGGDARVRVDEAGPGGLGGAASGALSGFQFGQGLQRSGAENDYYKALIESMKSPGIKANQAGGMIPNGFMNA
jgi:hypothetical protein